MYWLENAVLNNIFSPAIYTSLSQIILHFVRHTRPTYAQDSKQLLLFFSNNKSSYKLSYSETCYFVHQIIRITRYLVISKISRYI